MRIENPFNVDAALIPPQYLTQLPPHGGNAVKAFCGIADPEKDWDDRGICVLKARKGFGKSHLLLSRSAMHRNSAVANRTLFYPQAGWPQISVDNLSSLNVVIPRWLQGKESIAAWVAIWQLSILGLLVWITEARSASLRGYADWFSSLEALDQVKQDNKADAAPAGQAKVILTSFMGRVLERLDQDDYKTGMDQLQQGLYHGSSDWTIAIASRLEATGKKKIAMYLDAPDELVDLSQATLWRNVQQGLLLAIWKLSKSTTWGGVLFVYASVRSEAFGSGQDHADIALAMGLAMSLHYSSDDLELMLNDRIKQADPDRLSLVLSEVKRPIHALCGFEKVTHDDRTTVDGGRYTEDIFESILRHSRLVPREIIGIAGAIYSIRGTRSFDSVRRAVNAQASENIVYAIAHSFLGWNDALHRKFALRLEAEVIDGKSMEKLSSRLEAEPIDEKDKGKFAAHDKTVGSGIIKFFVQHGLIGTAEPLPRRHIHYYQQRFAFDEVHGNEDASSINKKYFFIHPALKEWIASLPEKLNTGFERLKVGAVGDMKLYEAKPPLFRLSVVDGQITLKLRSNRRLSTVKEIGVGSNPLRFLFVMLWACRELNQTHVTVNELRETLRRIRSLEPLSDILHFDIPAYSVSLGESIRLLAKRVNQNSDIRKLQKSLLGTRNADSAVTADGEKGNTTFGPFISVSAKESMGAQVEMWFPTLPLDEIDWDDAIHTMMVSLPRQVGSSVA